MVGAILEFMTSRHGYGHKALYGWVIFLMAVGAVFGAIAAAGARSRLQRNRYSARAAAARRELYAEAITSSPNPRRVQAQLREVGGVLELTLVDSAKLGEAVEVKTFSSIQEVESYLEVNTILRLGDFRTGVL